jgi:hypothetical protein
VRAVVFLVCHTVVINLRRSCKPTPMRNGTFGVQRQLKSSFQGNFVKISESCGNHFKQRSTALIRAGHLRMARMRLLRLGVAISGFIAAAPNHRLSLFLDTY